MNGPQRTAVSRKEVNSRILLEGYFQSGSTDGMADKKKCGHRDTVTPDGQLAILILARL